MVYTFDDIDLAMVRPGAIAKSPECGPRSTYSTRHIGDVCNDKAMVELLLSGDSDTGSANTIDTRVGGSAVIGVGVVDTDDYRRTVTGADETLALCCALVDVGNKTVGWIGVGEEVKGVEEAGSCVSCLQSIACGSSRCSS